VEPTPWTVVAHQGEVRPRAMVRNPLHSDEERGELRRTFTRPKVVVQDGTAMNTWWSVTGEGRAGM